MATATKLQNIHELYGHLEDGAARPPVELKRRRWLRIGVEESAGWLIIATGAIWAVNLLGRNFSLQSPALSQPTDIVAVGALIWLHAKWRRYTKLD